MEALAISERVRERERERERECSEEEKGSNKLNYGVIWAVDKRSNG